VHIIGRIFLLSIILIVTSAQILPTPAAAQANDETKSAVEQAIKRTFEMVRAHDYRNAYLALPNEARRETTLQNFMADLRESESRYVADRIEVKDIQVADKFALAHTTMYGRTVYPRSAEGKIIIQQLLVLEDGTWRVATSFRAFYKLLKKQQPELAKKYRIRRARVYTRDGNGWSEVITQ
jgi:predicted DNA-binding protein YlxM (UPF0122 family)